MKVELGFESHCVVRHRQDLLKRVSRGAEGKENRRLKYLKIPSYTNPQKLNVSCLRKLSDVLIGREQIVAGHLGTNLLTWFLFTNLGRSDMLVLILFQNETKCTCLELGKMIVVPSHGSSPA